MDRWGLHLFALVGIMLVSCSTQKVADDYRFRVDDSGKLMLNNVPYSLDGAGRKIFSSLLIEKVKSSNSSEFARDDPKNDNVISYYLDGNNVFDVIINQGNIYIINIYSPIVMFENESLPNLGDRISQLSDASLGCEVSYGEIPGAYVNCKAISYATLYTECERVGNDGNILDLGLLPDECRIDEVLLTSY